MANFTHPANGASLLIYFCVKKSKICCIVSIIYRVLYVFLVSNWTVYSKFLNCGYTYFHKYYCILSSPRLKGWPMKWVVKAHSGLITLHTPNTGWTILFVPIYSRQFCQNLQHIKDMTKFLPCLFLLFSCQKAHNFFLAESFCGN